MQTAWSVSILNNVVGTLHYGLGGYVLSGISRAPRNRRTFPIHSQPSRLLPLPISCLLVFRLHARHARRLVCLPIPRLDPSFRWRQYFLCVCCARACGRAKGICGASEEAHSLVAAKRCFVVDQGQGRKKCHFRRCMKVRIRPAVHIADGKNEDNVGPCRR